MLGTLFFRNKGAYIVGRLINLGSVFPFAIPLVRTPAGQVRVSDALLRDENDLSTLFSFTRAYFLVDMEVPAATVHFLGTLLPRKPKAELYTMIGLQAGQDAVLPGLSAASGALPRPVRHRARHQG